MKRIPALIILLWMTTSPLLAQKKVLAISGSTRKESYNTLLLDDAAALARQMGATVTVINLKDYSMPYYNADEEARKGLPSNAKRLRDQMIDSDAIIIASPEYNASIPGILKNGLDWASRKTGGGASRSAFKGKRFALISASPGRLGGARGLVHLKDVIEDIGGEVVPTMTTIPQAHAYYSTKDRPINLTLKREIQELLGAGVASLDQKVN